MMHKRFDFTQLGGFPFTQATLEHMQNAYSEAINALVLLIGDKVILAGVQNVGGIISNGFITYNGELLPFIGGTLSSGVVIVETSSDELFEDGQNKGVKFTKVARLGTPATFNFSELKNLGTILDLKNAHDTLQGLFAALNYGNLPGSPIKLKGSYNLGNVPGSDGFYNISIPDQPDNNYTIIGTMRGLNTNLDFDNDVSWVVGKFQNNQFQLAVREYANAAQNLVFDYLLIRM